MNPSERRGYGTGSLLAYTGAGGKETWYGRWYVGRKRVKRRIGPKRKPGGRKGLTRKQAEAELRRLMVAEQPPPVGRVELSLTEAAEHMLRHLEALDRKPTTLETYRSLLRTHLALRLGDVPIEEVTPRQVEALAAEMREEGKAAKTRLNALKLLSQIFAFAKRRGWCRENPCEMVDRPRIEQSADIRFLNQDELEALLAAVDMDQPLGHTDFALFLTAAMSGLRQGELLALRWRDVDWDTKRIRVRQNYVRGHWLTPKSRRGSRSVPLASRVAVELKRHFERSLHQGDEDLVFGHPDTGKVLVHTSLVERFKTALRAAGVRKLRFNDLRHTFGTRMAAAGVPMRRLQEWTGHRDYRTTLIYADYAPGDDESGTVDEAFS